MHREPWCQEKEQRRHHPALPGVGWPTGSPLPAIPPLLVTHTSSDSVTQPNPLFHEGWQFGKLISMQVVHAGDFSEIAALLNVSVGAEQAAQGQDALLGHTQCQ